MSSVPWTDHKAVPIFGGVLQAAKRNNVCFACSMLGGLENLLDACTRGIAIRWPIVVGCSPLLRINR
jgi:hypothetical protein